MNPFKGVITALVTPLKNNKIDEIRLRGLVSFQIASGVHGLVPCGTTGESATLSCEEKKDVIQIVIEEAKNRVPVIAGTGSNNTQETIEFTTWAKEVGAQGALIVTPYYNKPSSEGLFRHYEALNNIGIPIILYNVPSRTALSIPLETLKRMVLFEYIVGIKEATGSLSFASEIYQACGSKLTLLSGDDFTFLPFLSVGGMGVISVASNVVPKEFVQLYESFVKREMEKAQSIHYRLYLLMQALFVETNPIPVKTALAMMGKIHLEFRLPLCEMKKENEILLKQALSSLELI